MPKVLIGSGPIRHQPGPFRELLHGADFRTIDPPAGEELSEDLLRRMLPECEAIIAGGERISKELLESAPRLRAIARTGVGYDAVDIDAATARGVVVTITPGTNQESVAEQAFALLLAVARRIVENDRGIRAGGWGRTIVRPLREQTLGLAGLGRIGRAVVPRARAFGMRVLGFDVAGDPEADARLGVERRDFDDLLAESDVVSLHLPLTDRTRNLFDADRFARMKAGSILINTARGGLVDEAALAEALRSGHLAGAGLDVFQAEPTGAANPLLGLPNVVASPHIAGVDTLSVARMAEMAARCIVDLHRGRWPSDCVVNGGLIEGWSW